jgi:spermidine/putrescine transport system permease protein
MTAVGRTESRPAAAPPTGRGKPPSDARRWTFLGLSIPVAGALLLFIVAPIVLMVTMSLRERLTRDLLTPFPATFEHYERAVSIPAYWQLLQVSIVMAFVVALIATAIAYPIAYFLAFRAGKRASLYLLLLLVPFWTSYLLRVMAWKVLLGASGAINTFLLGTGLIDEPQSALLYNRPAVVMTLVYVWIPFATLPILAVLGRIDVKLHDAAADLYASPFQQFRRVTLPLSAPGIAAAFLMVFIPTIGEYVTPLLVGGNAGIMFGNTIEDYFTKAANWPLGSALSVIMLAVTLVLVVVGVRVVKPRRFLTA